MKIAQVAPLVESVPPVLYGGTERVVSYLTEELVRLGHDVTLYASGDSQTSARLKPICKRALRLDDRCQSPLAHHTVMLQEVFRESKQYDIIHFHTDYLHFPLARFSQVPHVTTLHGRLDLPDLKPLYREFSEMPVISISDSQRKPLPGANWRATIYNGIPEDLLKFHPEPGNYLAFIGRISPEKGIEDAIEIAIRFDMEIRIAAKIDPLDNSYFNEKIKPLLSHHLVNFIGEVGDKEKNSFLGNAYALLFPIKWPEPFGLVMIESMACGTPVIAYHCGAVPEVMRNEVTGFIVENIAGAVNAAHRISTINRSSCRKVFDECFSAGRMTRGYLNAYKERIDSKQNLHNMFAAGALINGRRYTDQRPVVYPGNISPGGRSYPCPQN
jgi:glycosyltransferase involved in cell wall biosynthesis